MLRPAFLALLPLALISYLACGGDPEPSHPTETSGVGGSGGGGQGGVDQPAGGGGGTELQLVETVRVLDLADEPVAGVPVVVSDALGEVTAVVETSAEGMVQVDVPEGGSVTAAMSWSYVDGNGEIHLRRALDTAFGLPAGGDLLVRQRSGDEPPPAANAPMSVVVEVESGCIPPLGTQLAKAFLSCASSGYQPALTPISFPEYAGCPGASTFGLTVIAYDGAHVPVGHDRLTDLLHVPGTETAVQLCPNKTDFDDTLHSVGVVPAGGGEVESWLLGFGAVDSVHWDIEDGFWAPEPYEGLGWTFTLPSGAFAAYEHYTRIVTSTAPIRRTMGLRTRSETQLDGQFHTTIDLAQVEELAPLDLSQPGRPRISWKLASEGDLGDILYLGTDWLPSPTEQTDWSVRLPAAREGSARLPALPAELSEFVPEAGDEIENLWLEHVDVASQYAPDLLFSSEPAHDNLRLDTVRSATATRSP